MFGLDLNTLIILVIGILLGGILFSKEFRVKFFKGFRNFISGLSRGAKKESEKYSGRTAVRNASPNVQRNKPEVQEIYKRVHVSRKCPTCEGTGRVYRKASPLQEGAPGYKPEAITCPTCDGEGIVWD